MCLFVGIMANRIEDDQLHVVTSSSQGEGTLWDIVSKFRQIAKV
jgi:hypothetical protein